MMLNLSQLTKLFICVAVLVLGANLICYEALYFPGWGPPQSRNKNELISQTRLANLSIFAPQEIQRKFDERRMKTLVWYDFYNKDHGLRNKGMYVNFKMCPYHNCQRLPDFTHGAPGSNIDELKDTDVVIFQGIHYANMKAPIPRSPGQIFVFAEREPGWQIGCGGSYTDVRYNNVFNWTMTFRRDSDIPMLYGGIYSDTDTTSKLLTEEGRLARRRSNVKKNFNQIFAGKDLAVVWLVSHCETYSLREKYVAELRKYIRVDIVGDCGQNSCPKHNNQQCLTNITKRYKFILSFENSFQTDYVTEKLYDWITRDIIQVVYGLADYANVVPHGTVINSANFVSPKHLANYLNDVGSSKDKYIRYLRRKDSFFTVGHTEMQQQAYCKLCEMVNTVDSHRKIYPNIAKWWQQKNVSLINTFVAKKVINSIGKCDEAKETD